jgi:hypothetical protein
LALHRTSAAPPVVAANPGHHAVDVGAGTRQLGAARRSPMARPTAPGRGVLGTAARGGFVHRLHCRRRGTVGGPRRLGGWAGGRLGVGGVDGDDHGHGKRAGAGHGRVAQEVPPPRCSEGVSRPRVPPLSPHWSRTVSRCRGRWHGAMKSSPRAIARARGSAADRVAPPGPRRRVVQARPRRAACYQR